MNSLPVIHVRRSKTVAAYDMVVSKVADISSFQRGCADAYRRTTCTKTQQGLKRPLL